MVRRHDERAGRQALTGDTKGAIMIDMSMRPRQQDPASNSGDMLVMSQAAMTDATSPGSLDTIDGPSSGYSSEPGQGVGIYCQVTEHRGRGLGVA